LGGIANVTWLPAGGTLKQVQAFDTGPGNMLIDLLAGTYRHGCRTFDRNGALAARGKIHGPTLRRLMLHPFFARQPPKSTGREQFGAILAGHFSRLSISDALSTATELTALSAARQITRWLPPAAGRAAVYVSGGGTRNLELMHRLSRYLAPRPVFRISALGYSEQSLEPVCFALLAHARLAGRINILPQVTGARRPASAGVIAFAS
jgi:anhydro-N-acetylmuramic acid kinase